MPRRKGKAGPLAEQRSYPRLTLDDRRGIERGLDRGESMREIARRLGRAPSTVTREVKRNRVYLSPRDMEGQRFPEGDQPGLCGLLAAPPGVCNGCNKRRCGCSRRPKAAYRAVRAQALADEELREARKGVDETESGMAMKLETIRSDLARGLSPAQIAATRPSLGASRSTIYRWVDEGYGGMSNMELRRKVGYKPRKRKPGGGGTRHSDRRSYAAFLALPQDARDGCWEMDTVEGRQSDSACLLTLHNRAARFQLALPMAAKTSEETKRVLLGIGRVLGRDGVRRVFRCVLTDNGSEFADEAAIAAAFGEGPGETRLFYCDPMRSDQKGACERNHVEVRKLLPKGRGISFDRLAPADCSLLMSQLNSEPRGVLAFMPPARMLLAAFGDDARAIMDAYGIELLDPSELDLTPACIERARAERGERPLRG
ncbi:IS30 family transposase [Collinsella sp. An2]|uniref:IS30 family transposase n=1 Tax=Collinsella sp. An2 TaxID=1965585 RepID=UPI000B386CEA|nr:IS30 family transposase [Collinsella sp. An2]OUP10373.1 IS30 family transposase [Collinsella sp. An2]